MLCKVLATVEPSALTKLTKPELAKYIDERTFQILDTRGRVLGTAFAIGPNQIVTCLHSVTYQIPAKRVEVSSSMAGGDRFVETAPAQTKFHETVTFKRGSQEIKGLLSHGNTFIDSALYELESATRLPYFEFSKTPPQMGEKVYFGGFPLTQNRFTFHKGMVSSTGESEFTIDGTIVPGNSGGPIIKVEEGRPVIVGMVISEVAQISDAFRRLEGKLTDQAQLSRGPRPMGDTTGLMLNETGILGDLLALQETVTRNMSTGIGRGLLINSEFLSTTLLGDHCTWEQLLNPALHEDLLVGKDGVMKQKQHEMLANYKSINQYQGVIHNVNETNVSNLILNASQSRDRNLSDAAKQVQSEMAKSEWSIGAGIHAGGLGGKKGGADPNPHITLSTKKGTYHLKVHETSGQFHISKIT